MTCVSGFQEVLANGETRQGGQVPLVEYMHNFTFLWVELHFGILKQNMKAIQGLLERTRLVEGPPLCTDMEVIIKLFFFSNM